MNRRKGIRSDKELNQYIGKHHEELLNPPEEESLDETLEKALKMRKRAAMKKTVEELESVIYVDELLKNIKL